MKQQISRIWKIPCSKELQNHLINNNGLSKRDRDIVNDLRTYDENTQFYADRVNLPVKRYNDVVSDINIHTLHEILRLAGIGLEYEQLMNCSE